MEPERECALGGTNKIVLLRDYRAACIRRVLSSARELFQERDPFPFFAYVLPSSLFVPPFLCPRSFRSFSVDFSTSESSTLLVTQKTKASSTVIPSMVTKPRVLFFIRASHLRQGQRRERTTSTLGKRRRSILFHVGTKRSFRNSYV